MRKLLRATWFNSFVALWKSWYSRSGRRQPRRTRPGWSFSTEQLEHRVLASNYAAASVPALIANINAANPAGGSNTVNLTPPIASPYMLTAVDDTADRATGLPEIAANDNLTIVGNDDSIQRSNSSGTAAFRRLDMAAGGAPTLQNLTTELINGVPITRYSGQQHLAPRERVELFIPAVVWSLDRSDRTGQESIRSAMPVYRRRLSE
jgi:hypothetical protein